jgi:hypothetical protein
MNQVDACKRALYNVHMREPIPSFHLPLMPGDEEPLVELNAILYDLYQRARYDLSLNYGRPPVPPLREEDESWARQLIEATS